MPSTRERLIDEAVARVPPPQQGHGTDWGPLLRRSLEASDTWLPWLVLYDNGHTVGYRWAETAEAAHMICVLGRGHLTESRIIAMAGILWASLEDAMTEETAGIVDADWDALLS